MNIQTPTDPHQPVAEKAEVILPHGLFGLPHLTRFQLLVDPEIYPLVVLRHLGEEEVDFMAVDPSVVLEKYSMIVPDADAGELELTPSGDSPIILNIAIVHPTDPKKVTVNLASPLIFNRQSGIGKQILLENSNDYSAEHELDINKSL